MASDIILPDDETMENLAREYAKIKAKTFTENRVTTTCSVGNYCPRYYFLLILTLTLIAKSVSDK